jgi:zinc D-Ala-D-Ala dipeptidase
MHYCYKIPGFLNSRLMLKQDVLSAISEKQEGIIMKTTDASGMLNIGKALLTLGFILFLLPGPAFCADKGDLFTDIINNNAGSVGKSGQIVLVTSESGYSTTAAVRTFEKRFGKWNPVGEAFRASVGHNGFAGISRKKEGDRKTPAGIYPLGTAFGYAPAVKTKMPYRQATENDFWVDDVNSIQYNMWVHGKPDASSYEKMKRDDITYRYGIVVEYNTAPIVAGMGSAIFIHVWRGPGIPTEGCIAMSEDNILNMLAWFDPSKKPLIIAGSESQLRDMKEGTPDCHGLVDINSVNPNIAVDIRYSTEDNFTKRKVYPVNKCFLRKAAAERLGSVQKELERLNLGLKVWDCYRPLSVQRAFWAIMPDERYVANPAKGSRHNRASAVDVTVVDSSGAEIRMPTGYDDFSEKAHRSYADLPKEARDNSRLLEKLMKKEGFIPYPTEWWHFDDPEWEKLGIMDIPFEQLLEAGCAASAVK